MSNIYSYWVRLLNDWEMHKTESSWEYHYTQKIFIANFLVSYLSLVSPGQLAACLAIKADTNENIITVLYRLDIHSIWRACFALLDRIEYQPRAQKGRLSTPARPAYILYCHWADHWILH